MTTLVWIKDGKTYRSTCGRFSIRKKQPYELHGGPSRRVPWILIDGSRHEDGYDWSCRYHSFAFAKANAQRVAETGRTIGAAS